MIQPNNRIHIGKSYKDEHFLKTETNSICEQYFDPRSKQISKWLLRVWMIICFLHKILKFKAPLSTWTFFQLMSAFQVPLAYQVPSHWRSLSHVHACIQTTLVEQFIELLWVRYPARWYKGEMTQWHGPDFGESLEGQVRYINTTQGSVRSDRATVGPQKSVVPKTVAHQNTMLEHHKNADFQPHFTIWIWIFFYF